MLARHPRAPLFPYTTLFRSLVADVEDGPLRELPVGGPAPSRHLLEVELQPFRVHLDRRRRLPPPAHLLRRRRVQVARSEEHTSELQSPCKLVCRHLLEKHIY